MAPSRGARALATTSQPQVLDSLHRLARANRADHPMSYLDTLIKTGSESIKATLRRRWILFAGFVRAWRIRVCRSAWCSENRWGARTEWGAKKKGGWGVSWTTS